MININNPMGTDGFEFVEYTAPDTRALEKLFQQMGFSAIARHRSKDVVLYRQGNINFIINFNGGAKLRERILASPDDTEVLSIFIKTSFSFRFLVKLNPYLYAS